VPLSLHLDTDEVRLAGGSAGDAGVHIAPGIDALLKGCLAQPGSLAFKMEAAISVIEDDLALVPRDLHRSRVASSSPVLRDIARAAGLADEASVISRDAVEQVFSRQSAVAMGRPAASEGLPEEPEFVAGLLLARELMHHLDIESISLLPAASAPH
jgi:hypothetical protein